MFDRLDTGRIRQVAIYGRVSTEHEAQLSAFSNQQKWYEEIAAQHKDWLIVGRYYDEGITGTSVEKRPSFMRMLEDARQGKFDLVITREVCRFARNTVDTLTVTRELKRVGVEVYFIRDNIWTMDSDGELRLSLMATLAQEESRKISERVLAGQRISRKNGTLYGNGNILGYDLVDGNYVINARQAYTVRKIFELYAGGMGYKQICAELTRMGCENAHGEVKWSVERIGRILRNATYKGYIGYNKSCSDGFLTQKRVNHREEDFVYVKGKFEPIVLEELWDRCEALRRKKSTPLTGPDGKTRKFMRKEPQSVWTEKLRCSCGSAFRRFVWRTNADGRKVYGFECYRQKRQVSRRYLEAHGLDASTVCRSKSIPAWQIDLMARTVFRRVWGQQREAVLMACRMIEQCAAQSGDNTADLLKALEKQQAQLVKKQEGLREMCALGMISREVFLQDNRKADQELAELQKKVEDLQAQSAEMPVSALDMKQIRQTLDQWVDFSGTVIAEEVIRQFILQVVVVDDDTFNWTLNFARDLPADQQRMNPSAIALQLYRDRQSAGKDGKIDTQLSRHITDPQPLLTFAITREEARDYCQEIGLKFFGKKWRDKTIIISI